MLVEVLPHAERRQVQDRQPCASALMSNGQAGVSHPPADFRQNPFDVDARAIGERLDQTRDGQAVLPSEPLDQGCVWVVC